MAKIKRFYCRGTKFLRGKDVKLSRYAIVFGLYAQYAWKITKQIFTLGKLFL